MATGRVGRFSGSDTSPNYLSGLVPLPLRETGIAFEHPIFSLQSKPPLFFPDKLNFARRDRVAALRFENFLKSSPFLS